MEREIQRIRHIPKSYPLLATALLLGQSHLLGMKSYVSVTCNVVTVTMRKFFNGGGQNEDNESIEAGSCCMHFRKYEDNVLEGIGAEWICR